MFAIRRNVPLLAAGILLSAFAFDAGFAKDNAPNPGDTTTTFCNARRCKNECVDAYPGGGGPLSTCRRLCDLSPTCGDKLGAAQGAGGMAKGTRGEKPKAAAPK